MAVCLYEDGTLTLSKSAVSALKALALVKGAKIVVEEDKLVARGSDGIQMVEIVTPVARPRPIEQQGEPIEPTEFTIDTDLFTKIIGENCRITPSDGNITVENGSGKFVIREVGDVDVVSQAMPELKYAVDARVEATRLQKALKAAGYLVGEKEKNINITANSKLSIHLGDASSLNSFEGDVGECTGKASTQYDYGRLDSIRSKLVGNTIGLKFGAKMPICFTSEDEGSTVSVLLAPVIETD